MSWEGYYVALCEKGHKQYLNPYKVMYSDPDPCGVCEGKIVWSKEIDQTNGCDQNCDHTKWSYCHEGPWIVKTPAITKTCDMGFSHIIEEETYEIPVNSRGKN